MHTRLLHSSCRGEGAPGLISPAALELSRCRSTRLQPSSFRAVEVQEHGPGFSPRAAVKVHCAVAPGFSPPDQELSRCRHPASSSAFQPYRAVEVQEHLLQPRGTGAPATALELLRCRSTSFQPWSCGDARAPSFNPSALELLWISLRAVEVQEHQASALPGAPCFGPPASLKSCRGAGAPGFSPPVSVSLEA